MSLRLPSAKISAPVIMDGKKLSDDEDEQFLVEEAVPQVPGTSEIEKVGDSIIALMIEKHQSEMVTCYSSILQGPPQELDSKEKHGTQLHSLFFYFSSISKVH